MLVESSSSTVRRMKGLFKTAPGKGSPQTEMEYVQLSPELPRCSRVWLGCWSFGGGKVWGDQSTEDSISTVRAAFDAGINVFDTAERYNEGRSEEVLGKALASIRTEVLIASKVRCEYLDNDKLTLSCHKSLKRLRTDYLDIYQVHWPNHSKPPETVFENLTKLKEQGKIRSYSVCNYGAKDIRDIPEGYTPLTNQLAYNLFFRAIEYGIVEACKNRSVPIVAYSPLSQGLLTGKYSSLNDVPEGIASTRLFSTERDRTRHHEEGCEEEIEKAWSKIRNLCDSTGYKMNILALQWILHKPFISSIVLGARSQTQVKENLAAYGCTIDTSLLSELDSISSQIKEKIGSNADMWNTDSKIR
jgi:myo-inositol catabolism protein IolS